MLGPLDLDVHAGECLALVGPNGAGKTTLLRLLAGLIEPTAGSLAFAGEPYRRFTRRAFAARVAYVPQIRPARVPLSVREVVLHGRYPHLVGPAASPREADFEAVARALATTAIEHLADRPLDELSGGERQAAYIAAALAQESPVLVLDEPTTFLDAGHQREVCALLARLHREVGQTVVLASHDLNFASAVADRMVALVCGTLSADGPPAEILTPERLAGLFGAPFEVVRGGPRPVTLVRLAP